MNSNQYKHVCTFLNLLVSELGQSAVTCQSQTCINLFNVYSSIYIKVNNAGIQGVDDISEDDAESLINSLGIFIAAVKNHNHQIMKEQDVFLRNYLP
ncbi:hypothetical protein ACSPAH_12585 [Buttiauxella agrestis]